MALRRMLVRLARRMAPVQKSKQFRDAKDIGERRRDRSPILEFQGSAGCPDPGPPVVEPLFQSAQKLH
jgi:hypothetical protein